MNAFFAPRFKLEMLYRVGHINFRPVDPCLKQRLIPDVSGWPNEWLALQVFLVTGLFPHKHDLRFCRPFSKYCLRRVPVKFAPFAFLNGLR